MYKIGVDIIEVKRIKEAIEKNENFKERVYSQQEINYCEKRKRKYESYAARFAAKEAYLKAKNESYNLNEIEVINNEKGKPFLYVKSKKINGEISLSHIESLAIASVILNE